MDLISRQTAIDAVCMEWCNVKHQDCKHPFDVEKDDYYWCDGCETALRTLPDLPSVERKKGRWVACTSSEHYKCSCCGTKASYWYNEENSCDWSMDMSEWLSDFCPNCGADMRERE